MTNAPALPEPPLLRLRGVTKAFPGVLAIRHADLDVLPGEIHALVGENGAGKSTLIKVATGAHPPDDGEIVFGGESVKLTGPLDARQRGLAAIYQEFTLVPAMTVRENLFLGREPARRGRIDRAEEVRRSRSIFADLNIPIDPETRAQRLTVAQQQLVETARALLADAQLLIMDEPTAALTPGEVERLFAILYRLREERRGILFISHRLDEVLHIADRVTVMRDGETLGTWPTADLSRDKLIELMVGRSLEQEFPQQPAEKGEVLLDVRGLSGCAIREASFQVHRGEVLGLAGLVGAGRTELARLIFGADRRTRGEVRLANEKIDIRTPRDAIAHGIGLLSEDRKAHGLVLGLSAKENFALPNLDHWSRSGWIDDRAEETAFLRFAKSLQIRVAGPEQQAGHLSGGNQQKLLVARWLENDARVLIFDEPTRGIDVGAKYEMYLLIHELASRGKAIIMISSDLEEILGMSDRVLVMHEGRICGELTDMRTASAEAVMHLAVGGDNRR